MTLNQLEYFCSVCRYQSISRAAEELFVSQPTISVSVRDLEKEFHLKLLNHQKNRISVTSEGQLFYERAEQLLRESREMHTAFSELARSRVPLKIGIPPVMSTLFFPRITQRFQSCCDIPVQLFEYGSVRARAMVDSDRLDLALVNMDFPHVESYHSYEIMRDSITYCVSRTHPYFRETAVTMDMLKGERVILFNTDSVLNRVISAKYDAAGLRPDVLMYSSQLYTILNMVRGGDCGAFLYGSLIINPVDFAAIPLSPASGSRFGIIWKKGGFIPHRLSSFIEFIKGYDMSPYLRNA